MAVFFENRAADWKITRAPLLFQPRGSPQKHLFEWGQVNWDRIIAGTLTLNGATTINWSEYNLGANPVNYATTGWNTSFTKTLISATTWNGAGSFTLPSDFTVSGQGFWHLAQVGNNVTASWNAVPEPGTLSLLGLGALALLGRRRKNFGSRKV